MSQADALIAEIKSQYPELDAAGLIDDTTLYRQISLGLRTFGNDVCYPQEITLTVKNRKTRLPTSFFSLDFAYKCDPMGFKSEIEKDALQSSYFYREKTIYESEWSECDACCEDTKENIIRENIYLNGKSVRFVYNNPVLLRLGDGMSKSRINDSCRNKLVRDCPYEINIINNVDMETNFESGYIYMKYNGLPADAEGNLDIPQTSNGFLEQFLEYSCKAKLAETLAGRPLASPLTSLLSFFAQKEQLFMIKARNELKMEHITPQSMRRIALLNRIQTMAFENSIRWGR